MPSNVENILNGILTGDGSDIQKPASRVEELLFEIYEQGGGGGDSVIGGIKLTINSDYVMTATLVDKDGEEYGVGDNIDLPLEEMVVDAEYDPQTQKIKLELKNGNFVEFSVAELVSGLQTELSSSNKLNPAYIAYDSSHRAVSDTEKDTWNAKQNAISDLDAIRSGAAAGATAVQPSVMQTALDGKQDTISDLATIRSGASAGATAVQPATMSAALAAKQDSLSETQLAAVNSGINSTKVAQIETNKTNILSIQDMVCDDTFSTSKAYAVDDITIYDNKLYKFKNAHQGTWSASDVDQISLSQLEAEDRAALVEVVDEGAKNIFDLHYENDFTSLSKEGLTATLLPDGTISVTGTPTTTEGGRTFIIAQYTASYLRKFNGYYMSGSVAPSGNVTETEVVFELGGSPYTRFAVSTNGNLSSLNFPNTSDLVYFYIRIYCTNTTTAVNLTFKPMIATKAKLDVSQNYAPFALPNSDLTQDLAELNAHPFLTVPINHNMIYRGKNLGDTLTDAQHTALSSGKFTDLYLGDYWTKTVTIPAFYEVTTAEPSDWSTNYTSYYTKSGDTYTPVSGDTAPTWAANTYYERLVQAQTVTLKAVIADFDTFYAGYASGYAAINTHHAAVIVHGFGNVVWNKTNTTAGGYLASLIHKWLAGSVLPQIETWFGSAKVLSHQKLLTNAITGDAASGWAWSSQKISLLSENQVYGSKVWGNSKAANGGYEPGEAFKHLNVFNHIDANLLFGNTNIWLRDIASAVWAADLSRDGRAGNHDASSTWIATAALILLS